MTHLVVLSIVGGRALQNIDKSQFSHEARWEFYEMGCQITSLLSLKHLLVLSAVVLYLYVGFHPLMFASCLLSAFAVLFYN